MSGGTYLKHVQFTYCVVGMAFKHWGDQENKALR